MAQRIVCQCCGRQIVSYPTDDQYTIGPPSKFKGCMNLGQGEYACPVCTLDMLEMGDSVNGPDEDT